jgi:ribonuclease J
MVNNVRVAMSLGYINIPEGMLVEMEEISNYPPGKNGRGYDWLAG